MQQFRNDCTGNDKPTLPTWARIPFNRCNLPAVILGSLTYQRHPVPLLLDGVRDLHRRLFFELSTLSNGQQRAQHFQHYMTAHFCLNSLDEAGLDPNQHKNHDKADYFRLLRGWLFDSDGREAAVIKGWAESRFGLLTRYHVQPIRHPEEPAYLSYLEARARGLYNTNALESQLDLVYEYAQFELARRYPEQSHLNLYRGVNRLTEHELLESTDEHHHLLLLNNISSFTENRERAEEFGDHILSVAVPLPKVAFFNQLLPGMLKGEEEFMVIGGVYEIVDSIF